MKAFLIQQGLDEPLICKPASMTTEEEKKWTDIQDKAHS